MRLTIGEAFDLRCERKCLGKRSDLGIKRERWQIRVKNHKDKAAIVRILHSVPALAEINEATHTFERRTANELVFEMNLDPDDREIIEFTGS